MRRTGISPNIYLVSSYHLLNGETVSVPFRVRSEDQLKDLLMTLVDQPEVTMFAVSAIQDLSEHRHTTVSAQIEPQKETSQ